MLQPQPFLQFGFQKKCNRTFQIHLVLQRERERERENLFYLHHNSQFSLKRKKHRIVSNIAKNAANEKIQKATKQVNTIAKQNNNNTKA